jgi:hypothetical protein
VLSQGFLEKITLLVVTAVLTGFLVPYVLKIVDSRKVKEQKETDARKAKEQKAFEAELTRQAKVIESQVQLLDNLTQALWEFQLLAIAVSYYQPLQDEALYLAALKKYDENIANILVKIRTEISKSLRLAPPSAHAALSELYYKHLLPLDQRLRGLVEKRAAKSNVREEWHEFNRFAVFELSGTVDITIDNLAKELGLKETKREVRDSY